MICMGKWTFQGFFKAFSPSEGALSSLEACLPPAASASSASMWGHRGSSWPLEAKRPFKVFKHPLNLVVLRPAIMKGMTSTSRAGGAGMRLPLNRMRSECISSVGSDYGCCDCGDARSSTSEA